MFQKLVKYLCTIIIRILYLQSSAYAYRIPDHLSPLKYTLYIKTFLPSDNVWYEPERNFTYAGNVKILIRCVSKTDSIVLHSKSLRLDRDSLRVAEYDVSNNQTLLDVPFSGKKITENVELEQITLHLEQFLESDKFYIVYLNYNGTLNDKLFGYYLTSYDENNEIRWMSATQLQPTFARYMLPCFDEPEFKSIFIVTMIYPKNFKALSNTVEERRYEMGNGWAKSEFKPTPKMSSYLLAIALTEFGNTGDTTRNNVTFRIWTRPSFVRYSHAALDGLVKTFQHFTRHFELSFPLEKVDVLVVPDCNVVAMENFGLIVHREMEIVVDPDNSQFLFYFKRLLDVMVHEVAHQWFGNLVTLKWWDDVWLNEAFSTYYMYIGAQLYWGSSYDLDAQFLLKSFQPAMVTDSLENSNPLSASVKTPTEFIQIFNKISYHKGAVIIRMFRNVIGKTVFGEIMKKYLSTFQNKNVDYNNCFQLFSEELKLRSVIGWENKLLNATDFLLPWIKQIGYPIIQVRRSENNAIILHQEKYSLSSSNSNSLWYIPVQYKFYKSGATGVVWLRPNNYTTLNVTSYSDDLFVLNKNSFAYVRTNYDSLSWALIRNQLITNHELFSAVDRTQFISDAFALAKIGKLQYETAFGILEYVINENEFIVWKTVFDNINWISDRLAYHVNKVFMQNYYKSLIERIKERIQRLSDISVSSLDGEANTIQFLRYVLMYILCDLTNADCGSIIEMSKRKLIELKRNCSTEKFYSSCNQLPTNMRQSIYCTGIAETDENSWNFFWNKYTQENIPQEKLFILYGLSCSKNTTFLQTLLDFTINGINISVSNAGYLFSFLSSHPNIHTFLWDYARNNWQKIMDRFIYSSSLINIAVSVTNGLSSEEELNQLEEFIFRNENNLGSSKQTFEQMLENTKFNVQWVKTFANNATNWTT